MEVSGQEEEIAITIYFGTIMQFIVDAYVGEQGLLYLYEIKSIEQSVMRLDKITVLTFLELYSTYYTICIRRKYYC